MVARINRRNMVLVYFNLILIFLAYLGQMFFLFYCAALSI